MSKKLSTMITKEQVEELYITKNLNKKEVSEILNIGLSGLSNLLKEYGITKERDKIVAKRKQTNIVKYGVDNPSKCDNIKSIISSKQKLNKDTRIDKMMKTKLERYGNSSFNNCNKNKQTKLEKYGDENYNNRDKYEKTMLSKYGVKNTFQLLNVKKAIHNNVLDNSEYTEVFKDVHNDRNKAIKFLLDNNYTYFDLVKLFNAPYYVVQNWVTRLDLKEYINFSFEGKSHYEDEIIQFLHSINVLNVERNVKNVLGNKQELDIYLPSLHLAIEFNGDYWHSDLYKDKNYHYNKSVEAEKCGIRLIHIWQHEWDDDKQKEKIKQLLRIACGKVNKIIYARNCVIKQISNNEAKPFNDATHLQGHRDAKLTYGLFYENKLVQLMSFSHSNKYEWEIIRGCPASNNIVVGGVGKLFKHFITENNPNEVFSYCDFNKFNGKSYESIGMKYIGITKPDLKYIVNGKVINRQRGNYKYIKNNIDARMYGCGSKKYLWEKAK